MQEQDQKIDGNSSPEEEEIVRGLLEMAGPRPPVPQEDLDAITAAARTAWQEQVRRRDAAPAYRPRRTAALALAAALIVAVGLVWWWVSRAPRGPAGVPPPTVARVELVTGPVQLETDTDEARTITTGEPILLGATLHTDNGRAALRLAGGATVRLDMETRLRFASATALELERGALYVDTGAGPRAAIEVRTPIGTVRDIGTQFAVRIADHEKAVLSVQVRDGSVRTEHRGRAYLTPAGQELVLHHDGRAERREVTAHGPAWEWVLEASPGFDIEGRTLREFLGWVSRETGWRVRYADAGLADTAAKIVLHGSIGDLRADRAPFAVLPGAGLEGELEDGTLVVRRR
jgi:ferric-dicitrate binding protein FerR (iron transport regulator)